VSHLLVTSERGLRSEMALTPKRNEKKLEMELDLRNCLEIGRCHHRKVITAQRCRRSEDKGIGDINYSLFCSGRCVTSQSCPSLSERAWVPPGVPLLKPSAQVSRTGQSDRSTSSCRGEGGVLEVLERIIYHYKGSARSFRSQRPPAPFGYYQWSSISASIRESSLVLHYSGFVNVASQA